MQVRHASQLLPKINQDSCSGNIVFSELDVVEFVVDAHRQFEADAQCGGQPVPAAPGLGTVEKRQQGASPNWDCSSCFE